MNSKEPDIPSFFDALAPYGLATGARKLVIAQTISELCHALEIFSYTSLMNGELYSK